MNTQNDNKYPLVSILFAVRNENDYISNALDSIVQQDYPEESIEIICVDGFSDDGTYEQLIEKIEIFRNLKVFRNSKRISAAGWNIGLEKSEGKYVLIISGHAKLSSNYIRECVNILQTSDYIGVSGPTTPVGLNNFGKLLALTMKSRFGVGNAQYFLSGKERIVETIVYGCYVKKALLEVGKFSEDIKRGQDWELNYRLRNRGYKLFQTPKIRSKYYVRSDLKSVWKRHFEAGKWKVKIIYDHPSSILPRHIIPLFFSLVLISLLFISFLNLMLFKIFLGIILCYFLAAMAVSISFCLKNSIKSLLFFPVIFFAMHFSYGLGMIIGIAQLFVYGILKKKQPI
ncbi:glycosyltransferase family 2 protein [candidate division KSB1 bacterium]|nr:glycosyltransferase family 2 protein [candidate division KSB1 bacterium]